MKQMLEVTPKKLKKLLKKHYEVNQPLFIWGKCGIGKTMITNDFGQDRAKDLNRKFIDWNELTEEEKESFIMNGGEKIKESFIMSYLKASQCDSTSTSGIPNFTSDKKYLVWTNDIIWRVFEHKEARGIIFLDEFNLAPPLIQSSFYSIINDRKVGNISINPYVMRIACGNTSDDKANIYEMASPLYNRFSHCELILSTDEWISWAMKNEVDARLIAFISFKENMLYTFKPNVNDKIFATPRTVKLCSDKIKGVEDDEELYDYTATTVGVDFAEVFTAHVKLQQQLDIDKILNNPEMVADIQEFDVKYSFIGAVAERYKKKKDLLAKCLKLSINLEPEFASLLLRLIKTSTSTANWMKETVRLKEWEDVYNKYGKFILD